MIKNNVYIETTTWNLDAPKIEFSWVEENGQVYGRLVAHNEDRHTYVEVNLDSETVAKLRIAMLAGVRGS
jgi:hypothetical protein